jgi:imidazolonepropionase-like amidohydrolase
MALATLASPSLLPRLAAQTDSLKSLALTHAAVIDVAGGAVRRDQTIVIVADRIQALGNSATVKVPAGARIVDATGKYVIPGLWDSHVHTRYQGIPFLSLFILNGITSVRDTAGPWTHLEQIKEWKRQIARGELLGPRIYAAGPLIDGPSSRWTHGVIVNTPEEGRQAVRDVKARGGDFVKVYDLLSRESYFAIVDESRKVGLPFAGHTPFAISVGEASDAGQRTIEHLTGILLATSTREEELRRDLVAGKRVSDAVLLDTYSQEKASALFARFARNQTVQDPTLSNAWTGIAASLKDFKILSEERLQYIPASYREQWGAAKGTGEDVATRQRVFEKEKEIVISLQKAGVGIISGTDTLKPYLVPGFSLQDELEILGQAGLTPLQVLQAATVNPAREFKIADLGTVEQGKIADLVVLDADPLQEIRNTRKIFAVVANGRLVDKKGLGQLALEAKTSAAQWKGAPTGR